jgi:hypothetical protein
MLGINKKSLWKIEYFEIQHEIEDSFTREYGTKGVCNNFLAFT